MIGFLLGLINPLERIGRQIADTKIALAKEQNNERRIALEAELGRLGARQAVIFAAQSDPMERWVRIGFALPFVLYINKLIIWDKVLGWGATDPLSDDLTQIMLVVLGGYFIDTVVRRFTR